MRLWSLHPKYLDRMGLVALWREALLAQKVLLGQTKGYRAHPQLERFRASSDPLRAIGCYLTGVLQESGRRGYRFNGSKIVKRGRCRKMAVRKGQMDHEWKHLLRKLKTRTPETYDRNRALAARPKPHPLFRVIPGGVETWERILKIKQSRSVLS